MEVQVLSANICNLVHTSVARELLDLVYVSGHSGRALISEKLSEIHFGDVGSEERRRPLTGV